LKKKNEEQIEVKDLKENLTECLTDLVEKICGEILTNHRLHLTNIDSAVILVGAWWILFSW